MGSKRQGERWWRQVTHGGCGYGYYYKSTLVTFVTFATVWIISWKAELTIQWLKDEKLDVTQSIFHITGFSKTRRINARQIFGGIILLLASIMFAVRGTNRNYF